jgi:CheY-like chemotaxis protein
VLLAEDNRTNARILAAMLRRAGYRVDHAADGAAAVEAALRLAPDLVLMDLSMPVIGGFAALAAIRRAEAAAGRRSRILALTADATAACREACRAAGFDGFLTKPVRRDDLLAALAAPPARPPAEAAGVAEQAPAPTPPGAPQGAADAAAARAGTPAEGPPGTFRRPPRAAPRPGTGPRAARPRASPAVAAGAVAPRTGDGL